MLSGSEKYYDQEAYRNAFTRAGLPVTYDPEACGWTRRIYWNNTADPVMSQSEFRERIRTSLANPTLQSALDANAERRVKRAPRRVRLPARLARAAPAGTRRPGRGDRASR